MLAGAQGQGLGLDVLGLRYYWASMWRYQRICARESAPEKQIGAISILKVSKATNEHKVMQGGEKVEGDPKRSGRNCSLAPAKRLLRSSQGAQRKTWSQ